MRFTLLCVTAFCAPIWAADPGVFTPLKSTDVTPATSPLAAATTVAGGLGVAKQSWFGDFVYVQRDGSANVAALYRASSALGNQARLLFAGTNSASTTQTYAAIGGVIEGSTAGSEQGGLILGTRKKFRTGTQFLFPQERRPSDPGTLRLCGNARRGNSQNVSSGRIQDRHFASRLR